MIPHPIFLSILSSFFMFWEILWPLLLGFMISAFIQIFVSHKTMASLLGKDTPKCFSLAAIFGAASSSCSYAAVALSRAIFKKGATFTSSMIFELASTNLVVELGVILLVLMGWQFALSEFLGGIIMVILIALMLRFTLTKKMVEKARIQAEKGISGKMEGHSSMDMTGKNLTSLSHYFIMDISSVWVDIVLGLLIAGAISVFVPSSFWQTFFFKGNPAAAFIEGPIIGPLVAVFSFVCSVGNVPLAAVLWKEGISFGGVASFIFADLIVLPVLDIYRKYYGFKMMVYILSTFYLTMVISGYIIEIIFSFLGIIPTQRNISLPAPSLSFNYTLILNTIFLVLGLFLFFKFLRTGGPMMLKMMNKPDKNMTGMNREMHKH